MNYIFNGNWVIDWPGTYQVAGTTIVYDRSFDGNETITSKGPTEEDLHIMVTSLNFTVVAQGNDSKVDTFCRKSELFITLGLK